MLSLPKAVLPMALLVLLLPTALGNAGVLLQDDGSSPCVYAVSSEGSRQTGPFTGSSGDTIVVGVRSADPSPGFEFGLAVRPTKCFSSSVVSGPLLP